MEYGLIGEKLTHSFSKEIHTKYFGLNYELKELSPNEVEPFLMKKDFKAINVTIPYKQKVMPYLDFISDEAQKIGAVNVIVNRDGKLYGYNTDYSGLRLMLESSGVDFKGKNVLILGDGATSKTAFAVAEDLGALSIKKASRKKNENTVSYAEASALKNTQIIINTTPVGMYPNIHETLVNISDFPNLEGVFDVVYNPLRSRLVVDAKNQGITATGGLYMLVAQAVFAAEKFGLEKFDTSLTDQIYNEILNQKQNIVLVGMPASGKSTVGELLAEDLGIEFIDTDIEIVKKNGEIARIFEEMGESGFREIETKIIKEIATLQNKVIATGGGAVLRKENVNALKQNGKIYFLDRPLEDLVATNDRPLAQTSEMLAKRYKERYQIYCDCADIRIDASGSKESVLSSIKGDFLK